MGGGTPDGAAGPGDPALGDLDHYKCYRVEGPPVEISRLLIDQFQGGFTDVLFPEYLCNPVEKTHLDVGTNFPILRPTEHLVCYQINFPPLPGLAVSFRDQFIETQVPLDFVDLLCVPSLKEGVVQVEDSSWGKVKSIYR